MDSGWIHELRQREDQRLRQFAAETFPGRRVDLIVEAGDPGDVIDNVVRHQGTDLAMMPTHGRGAVRRLLLGSVTAKVLHDIDAAVWTASAPKARPKAGGSYKSILCSVDLGEETEAVMKAAAVLAGSY